MSLGVLVKPHLILEKLILIRLLFVVLNLSNKLQSLDNSDHSPYLSGEVSNA